MSVIVNGCNDGQKCTWDQGGQLKLPKRQKRLGMSYLIDSINLNMAKRQTINVNMREKLRKILVITKLYLQKSVTSGKKAAAF